MQIVIADRAYLKHPDPGSAEWLLLHRALACVNHVAVDIGNILRLRLSFDQWIRHKEVLEQGGFVIVWPPTEGTSAIQPPKGAITGEGLQRFGKYVRNLERRAASSAKPIYDPPNIQVKWSTSRPESRQYKGKRTNDPKTDN